MAETKAPTLAERAKSAATTSREQRVGKAKTAAQLETYRKVVSTRESSNIDLSKL